MARLRAVRLWALAELATGFALLGAPGTVIDALVGPADATASLVGRVLGATLVSLGLVGALGGGTSSERLLELGFVVYYVSTTVILAAAGIVGTADGVLLWPAVALHGLGGAFLALGLRSTS